MTLTPALREQLRLTLLRQLEGEARRYGLPAATLRQLCLADGFPCAADVIEQELEYLQEKQLVQEVSKQLSPELRAWKISAQGRDFLAQNAV